MSKRSASTDDLPDPKRPKQYNVLTAPIPSVAALFAKRDAKEKAHAARVKAEKEKFDMVTLSFVRGRIESGLHLELIEPNADGKRGYRVVMEPKMMLTRQRTYVDFIDIVPVLQTEVGETSDVTCTQRGDAVVITVMEL